MPRRSSLKDHCLSLPGTTEDEKWGAARCYSVGGKLYAAFDLDNDNDNELSFKCSDEDFDTLTDIEHIIPAPYFAKMIWVRVSPEAKIPIAKLRTQLTKAHALIAAKLSKKKQRELGLLND